MAKKTPEKAPAAPAAKSTVSWDLLEDNSITRSDGKETITVATLNGEAIEYKDANMRKLYHPAVVQFLTDENVPFKNDEITVHGTSGAELVAEENTEEFNASIPKPPRQNIRQGDKTPAYVEWLQKYKPNTFKQKYGIIGKGKVTKRYTATDPITGRTRIVEHQEDALLATRKTHLTELETAKVDTSDEYDA
jgi:hypothetical protein